VTYRHEVIRMQHIREPRVAGQFYPSPKQALLSYLEQHIDRTVPKKRVRGVIMPHAGYIYSGTTAALTIQQVEVPQTVLLIGPNHTGYGTPFSLMTEGTWRFSFGDVPINREWATKLCAASPLIAADEIAHQFEHSLEVEVPFLYYMNPLVSIVPLTVGTDDRSACRAVAEAIAGCMQGGGLLVCASTDMTHYEPAVVAEKKDREAIEAIQALDAERLAAAVERRHITMCGFLPVYMTLIITKILGARSAELIDYRTSGDASGDYDRVVGYAGMIIP